ncbi:ATP-binding protein [Spirochaeta dissipatitropha]
MDIQKILRLDDTAVKLAEKYQKKRFAWSTLSTLEGRPFVLLIGPRGAGKSVLLRQLRSNREHSLYLSADTMDPGTRLEELLPRLNASFGIENFFIDEIHFLRTFPAALKELHDFSNLKIWCSSSAAVRLQESAYDLSRRVQTEFLHPFSFREYLYFHHEQQHTALSLESVFQGNIPSEYLRSSIHFQDYLTGGLYPASLEPGFGSQQFKGILHKIIQSDIPACAARLNIDQLLQLEKIMKFIGKSSVDGISYSSLSRNIGISKYMAEKLVSLLEQSFLLQQIFPAGTSVSREPKILMELPYRLQYKEREDCIGGLREDFFASAMRQHGMEFQYAKSTRGSKTPDFLLEIDGIPAILEVGGKGKGRTQFKDIQYKKKIILRDSTHNLAPGRDQNSIIEVPLHCIGFA